jgi:rubredoxin
MILIEGPFAMPEQPTANSDVAPGKSLEFLDTLRRPAPASTDVEHLSDLQGARIYCKSNTCGQAAQRMHRLPTLVAVVRLDDDRVRVASHPRAEGGSRLYRTSRRRRSFTGLLWQDLPAELQCPRCGAHGVATTDGTLLK